jgi:NAD(P)-dependent dehydrogenase (short-subunit alcohol dehydrogenase family)
MKLQSNTIFITGATSGIGQGLAEAFHKLGNQVIISGRREERLKSICGANPSEPKVVPYLLDPSIGFISHVRKRRCSPGLPVGRTLHCKRLSAPSDSEPQ